MPAFKFKIFKRLWYEKFLPIIREGYWDSRFMNGPFFGPVFKSHKYLAKLSRFSFFRNHMPEFDPERSEGSWLPINHNIQGADDIVLPLDVTDRIIEKAKHIVLLEFCYCRKAMKCHTYPTGIGCIMMGESALEIPIKVRREITVDEAKEHVRKAINKHLVPVIGKIRPDNDFLMLPDRGKLMTLCFCCECCCVARLGKYIPRNVLNSIFRHVEGLSIEITAKCNGCGKCVSKCYLNAINLIENRAVMSDLCCLCGRCALHCPSEAIKLTLENDNVVDDIFKRIDSVVDY